MINFKKMDDKDFVFISKPLSEKQEKEFSDFLKLRKAKVRRSRSTKKRKYCNPNSLNYCSGLLKQGLKPKI